MLLLASCYHNYRGDSVTVQKGKIVACTWQDNKAVTVMFTNCPPASTGTVLQCQRDSSRKQLPCPQAIINYNLFMGGVDKGDQSRCYYTLKTKSRKLYKYSFSFSWMLPSQMLVSCINTLHLLSFSNISKVSVFNWHAKCCKLQLLPTSWPSRRNSILHRQFPTTLSVKGTTHHKWGRCKVCKAKNICKDAIWHCKDAICKESYLGMVVP